MPAFDDGSTLRMNESNVGTSVQLDRLVLADGSLAVMQQVGTIEASSLFRLKYPLIARCSAGRCPSTASRYTCSGTSSRFEMAS
jgi:hypothetical protein